MAGNAGITLKVVYTVGGYHRSFDLVRGRQEYLYNRYSVECRTLEGADGTLHIWAIPGAGWEGECLRSGARGRGDGDAGGGGVLGGAWVPGGAECAAVLPAFAMEGCGDFRVAREVAAYGEVFGAGGEVAGGAAGCEAVCEDLLRESTVYSRQSTVSGEEFGGETEKSPSAGSGWTSFVGCPERVEKLLAEPRDVKRCVRIC